MTQDTEQQYRRKWDRRLAKVAVVTTFAVSWVLYLELSPWNGAMKQYSISEAWPAYVFFIVFVLAWVEATGWMFNGVRIFK